MIMTGPVLVCAVGVYWVHDVIVHVEELECESVFVLSSEFVEAEVLIHFRIIIVCCEFLILIHSSICFLSHQEVTVYSIHIRRINTVPGYYSHSFTKQTKK